MVIQHPIRASGGIVAGHSSRSSTPPLPARMAGGLALGEGFARIRLSFIQPIVSPDVQPGNFSFWAQPALDAPDSDS
jgi:hypothetical protein